MAHNAMGLPVLVASPVDLGRLIRELESVNEEILQSSLRHEGHDVKQPKVSRLLDQTLELNKLNLMKDDQRKHLYDFLVETKQKTPIIHMSFSADPAPAFMEKLVTWLRKEVHPLVLVTVGLQPGIGAGCIVRTTNKYFDLSLKQDFGKKRDLLMQTIAEKIASHEKPVEVAA